MYHKTMLLIICLIFTAPCFVIYADDHSKESRWSNQISNGCDDDTHGKRKHDRHRDGKHSHNAVRPDSNPVYKAQCGSCHLAYPPELLPESSWLKLLEGIDDHFEESVELDADSQNTIKSHLISNSADHSSTKQAAKIMNCLNNSTPLRITEIPYIIKEHHKINPETFTRKAIGSFSNCAACHTGAEEGNYDDDNVKIPQ